jgi:hypothetical protein
LTVLDINKKIIKPMECKIGTELLHGYPAQFPEYDTMDVNLFEMKNYFIIINILFIIKVNYNL